MGVAGAACYGRAAAAAAAEPVGPTVAPVPRLLICHPSPGISPGEDHAESNCMGHTADVLSQYLSATP
jgi:hypothetical protein